MRALLLVAALVALGAANKLIVLQSYSTPTGVATCTKNNFLETVWEFSDAKWCVTTPTSNMNYEFAINNASTIRVIAYAPSDTNCTKPVSQQINAVGTCFKMYGDNPVLSYSLSIVDGVCASSNCPSGSTCCYSPQGPQCVQAENACCCPDFQNACASGSMCGCSGTCPGPDCSCQECVPAPFGLCL